MPSPRNRTNRRHIRPEGVAERLKDAPPTRYTYGASKRVLHWCKVAERYLNAKCECCDA